MVTAIVLAAGLSSRMRHANKLLLPFRGKTVIETVVENILDARIKEVIVVTGSKAELIEKAITKLPVRIVHNPEYASGMTTSIQSGVSVAKGEGYMICMSDMPLITAEEYNLIVTSFLKQKLVKPNTICIPQHCGVNGNPVLFSNAYKSAILQHSDMSGCKQILQSNKDNLHLIEMSSNSILKDMDTVEAYQQLSQD